MCVSGKVDKQRHWQRIQKWYYVFIYPYTLDIILRENNTEKENGYKKNYYKN